MLVFSRWGHYFQVELNRWQREKTKNIRSIIRVSIAILLLLITSCATIEKAGHKYIMRGQVLEVSDNIAYLCIGSKDGAQIG